MGLGAALHQVVVSLLAQRELAFVVDQHTFLLGQVAGFAFAFADPIFKVGDAHVGFLNQVVDVFEEGPLGGNDLFVDLDDLGVLVGQGKHQGSLLLIKVDQVLYQLVQQGVADAHSRGSGQIVGIVDVFLDVGL